MLTKLILSLLTINILMKTTSTQYYTNEYYGNMPQQYYQQQPEPQEMDYEEPMDHEHTRRTGRYKKYGSSGGRLPNVDYEYDESDECKCSCKRCKDTHRPPKLCCREVCFSCSERQDQQGQGGLVFVPYPYPLMVPNLIRNETTTSTTTTAKPTTTKTTSSDVNKDKGSNANMKSYRKNSAETINDFILRSPHILKGDRKYMLTTMRKTKPTWEPKYGIVPIPDNLAEKLMSQLRQVRELQSRRF